MTRYRIVTRTVTAGGSETHVSSVILSRQEAIDDVSTTARIASLAGWHTATLGHGIGVKLVCTRGEVCRSLTIRESDPFDDTL